MVCIDTNIIVRHLHDGDKRLGSLIKTHKQVLVPLPVWFEAIYMMEKVYGVERPEIEASLILVLMPEAIVAEKNLLVKVLRCFVKNPGLSVIDCYLAVFAKESRATLITDDRKLVKYWKS
jgi:predicted nucleic acid-binding protein